MPLPFSGRSGSGCMTPSDISSSTVSHLEPVNLDERKEVHVGSLGLGTALAVAYDLYNDFPAQMASHIYSPQLGGFIPLSTVKAPSTHGLHHANPPSRAVTTSDIQQYAVYPTQSSCVSPDSGTWSTQHSDAYLTPITVSSASSPTSTPITNHIRPFAVVSDNNKLRLTNVSLHKSMDGPSVVYIDPTNASNSVTVVVDGTSITSTSVPALISAPVAASSISNLSLSHVLQGPSGQTIVPFSTQADGAVTHYPQPHTASPSSTSVTTVPIPDSKSTSSDSNSYAVDESLYEITEEEMREIDASLANNPDVMASRQWKYYTETNEWTRATCALMACLFTRDQMANSTVLGRGGSQRARLPSNLVAYVVGTIRKRFNKPAAAVRARMAQKCKDERRFGRLTVTGSGTVYSVDGQEACTLAPVAAISGKCGGVARKARKRSAAALTTTSHRPAKSSNGSTPPSDFASTPGYQPTAYNDDACSSTTDSNQLPPLALSPSTELDPDMYLRPTEDYLQLPTPSQPAPPHTLSMMLMVPNMDSIDSQSSNDQNVLANHLPPSTELAS